ncbi:MAG: PstS family phosphate ABC transporter substrate-binding protein [Holophagales bacterium]|nr:PstS family phosphate ABC transporter substrate-binding protein [Holophagales bacterium]
MKANRSILPYVLLLTLATACGRPAGDGSGTSRGGRALIQNKGSDTLVNVAQAWAEAYKEVDPAVAVAVSGGGSGTGISALINGTVDLANTSRQMKKREMEAARQNGVEPVEHVVGFDALAVYLHHDHPAESMSLEQLAEIYGEGGSTERWSQLGYEVPGCQSDEIVRVSRQNNSGTYVYFQEAVLGKERDFKLGSRDMHGSKDVVDLVEKTPCAIGYSGLAYATEEIKLVCVAMKEGNPCVSPTVATAVDGTYPIARPLFMYTRGQPEGAVAAYLDWILSDAGQCILQGKGYAPARKVDCGSEGG